MSDNREHPEFLFADAQMSLAVAYREYIINDGDVATALVPIVDALTALGKLKQIVIDRRTPWPGNSDVVERIP